MRADYTTLAGLFAQAKAIAVAVIDAPWWAKIGALLAGMANAVWSNMFGGAFLITTALAVIDWFEGRRAARAAGVFDAVKSTAGLNAKTVALTLLIIVRAAEAWAAQHGIFSLLRIDTVLPEGAIATFFAALYARDQWDSIHRHLNAQGHPTTFGSIASNALGGLLERAVPKRRPPSSRER